MLLARITKWLYFNSNETVEGGTADVTKCEPPKKGCITIGGRILIPQELHSDEAMEADREKTPRFVLKFGGDTFES